MLKKLSGVLNTDVSYLLKGGVTLGIGHTTGVFLGFCLSLVFANLVEVSVYGQYKYILSIAGILGAFTLSGAAATILQSVAKGYDGVLFAEQRSYLRWSLLSVILACFVGGYYIVKGDIPLGGGVIIATCGNYLFNSLTLQNPFLSAKKDFKRLTVNQILTALILLASVTGAVFYGYDSALWILVVYFSSQILFQAVTYFHMLSVYKPGNETDPADKHLSKHLSLGNIITSFAEYLDKILLFQFFGPGQVALYAFAVGMPDQIRGVNKMLGTLVVPKLSPKDNVRLTLSIYTHTKKYFLFSLFITILFYFISPYLFTAFFPAYIDAIPLASLYMLVFPISALSIMHSYGLQIKRDVRSLYIIRTVDSLGRILLFITLIPLYGVLGAILTILISKMVATILQIAFYHYKFGIESSR